ncbi:MAG: hypothetical protein MK052_05520 [Alphaproteobacteria bacterium]|nr:hypothetical protein [Alphaproteobacteria bacterium]
MDDAQPLVNPHEIAGSADKKGAAIVQEADKQYIKGLERAGSAAGKAGEAMVEQYNNATSHAQTGVDAAREGVKAVRDEANTPGSPTNIGVGLAVEPVGNVAKTVGGAAKDAAAKTTTYVAPEPTGAVQPQASKAQDPSGNLTNSANVGTAPDTPKTGGEVIVDVAKSVSSQAGNSQVADAAKRVNEVSGGAAMAEAATTAGREAGKRLDAAGKEFGESVTDAVVSSSKASSKGMVAGVEGVKEVAQGEQTVKGAIETTVQAGAPDAKAAAQSAAKAVVSSLNGVARASEAVGKGVVEAAQGGAESKLGQGTKAVAEGALNTQAGKAAQAGVESSGEAINKAAGAVANSKTVAAVKNSDTVTAIGGAVKQAGVTIKTVASESGARSPSNIPSPPPTPASPAKTAPAAVGNAR